jgi:hypothetical protein
VTGPLDESAHPAGIVTNHPERWRGGTIRALAVAADNQRGWRIDLDVDEDREPHEGPTDVRFALISGGIETLRQLARRIDQL